VVFWDAENRQNASFGPHKNHFLTVFGPQNATSDRIWNVHETPTASFVIGGPFFVDIRIRRLQAAGAVSGVGRLSSYSGGLPSASWRKVNRFTFGLVFRFECEIATFRFCRKFEGVPRIERLGVWPMGFRYCSVS
jgi:hypothetical protein